MQSHPPGRPRSLTLEKQKELLAHVAHGGTVEEAAHIVGVSLRTVQREAKGNEFFDHDLKLAQHSAEADPEKLMHRAARAHWRAAAWLLERSDPDRYGKRPPNSCSPENLYDIALWLVETALESVPPEHRELLHRRMKTVADTALDLLMPHPAKIRNLTRALAYRPTPLTSHEENKMNPPIYNFGDPLPTAEWYAELAAKETPEAICTAKPGDAAISDADFARRLTLLKQPDKPYRSKSLPKDFCNYSTPGWQLEGAAPSEEEGAAGALWDEGNAWKGGLWENGERLPDDDEDDDVADCGVAEDACGTDGVVSPKMKETTKSQATEPTPAKSATKTGAQTGSGAANESPHNDGCKAAAPEAGPSYEEMVAGIRERRERYLAAIAAARQEESPQKPSRNGDAKARNWLDRFRTRGKNGNGKAA
jgi:hypothetical protein